MNPWSGKSRAGFPTAPIAFPTISIDLFPAAAGKREECLGVLGRVAEFARGKPLEERFAKEHQGRLVADHHARDLLVREFLIDVEAERPKNAIDFLRPRTATLPKILREASHFLCARLASVASRRLPFGASTMPSPAAPRMLAAMRRSQFFSFSAPPS